MNATLTQNETLRKLVAGTHIQRGLIFGVMIIGALCAFELFNYSTTEFALADLLGDLRFAGVRWSTILSVAFCGIDFAGIARLFTPAKMDDEPREVWYLFGAWLLAATMNAMLTWWGVSIAILGHQSLGSAVIERQMLLRIVPVFVAILVWLIRVLIIGTFSAAGDRLFSQVQSERRPLMGMPRNNRPAYTQSQSTTMQRPVSSVVARPGSSAPAASHNETGASRTFTRPEPTYQPVSMSGRTGDNGSAGSIRR